MDKKVDNAKYVHAKKKYSKRRLDTVAGVTSSSDELVPEEYLIHHM